MAQILEFFHAFWRHWQTLLREERGQDLIEYALMAGFVAVAAAAVLPSVTTSISTVFSKVSSVMNKAAAS